MHGRLGGQRHQSGGALDCYRLDDVAQGEEEGAVAGAPRVAGEVRLWGWGGGDGFGRGGFGGAVGRLSARGV